MRRWVVAFVVLFLLSLPLLASCDEEDINTVAKDGEIIVLTDGSAWESDDPGTSSTWLSADTVLVCNDAVMINKDEDGERVGVTRTSYDPDANDDDDDDDEPHVLTVKDAANKTSRCATVYSVILQDTLGNIQQGISKPKNVKWATKDLEKKYPDVCYAPPGPSVKTVFFLTATPATYHGTRIVRHTETHDTPINGQVNDNYGQQVGTIDGTTTSTTTASQAVPYSFRYPVVTLTVETIGADGKPVVRHRFQQNGIYHTMYGIPLGGRGHHPAKALIEDAVKWIHAGGLDDPLQSFGTTQ